MTEKLLIMGVDTSTQFIIREAKKRGLYTILTDYLLLDESPLKKQVDEAWFENVGNLDVLEQKCRETGVTAVIAGNHEFCLDCTKELCRRLGLPFYASDTCWEIARDKEVFKRLCRECGVPVAKDYSLQDAIQYPVCVKPSDSSGSRGISYVYDAEDLEPAYDKALSFSENNKIIIEQLLTGTEVMLVGYADRGHYHLLHSTRQITVTCSGRTVFSMGPDSPPLTEYILDRHGEALWSLLREMEVENGMFTLQGFLENDGNLYLLEPAIRLDGMVCCEMAGRSCGIHPVGWMVDLARGIHPEINWQKIDTLLGTAAFTPYLPFCNAGTIASIEGMDEIEQLHGVNILLKRFSEGDTVKDVGDMTQGACYLQLTADSPKELVALAKKINSTLRILDQNGKNLLIHVTDYDRMMEYMTCSPDTTH